MQRRKVGRTEEGHSLSAGGDAQAGTRTGLKLALAILERGNPEDPPAMRIKFDFFKVN